MHAIVSTKLETDRLILRKPHIEDWKDLHELYSDAEAIRYTIKTPLEEPASWRMTCVLIGHWTVRGYGVYSVEEKATGKVLGGIGFWYPLEWPSPEIKWSLAAKHHGKGFASEAARAVLAEGHKSLPDIHLISMIDKNNIPSQKLAEAVGAKLEKEVEFRGTPHVIYRHKAAS